MDGLRQYVISIVTAALICGMVSAFFQNGAMKELIRLLCGLFLTLTVIHPIVGLDFAAMTEYAFPYLESAEGITAQGENMARESLVNIIKAESEAYILDKADALNVPLTVEVTISEEDTPVPISAVLGGEVSPYARQKLESLLEADLGITKENQVWTG